ncbi:hypothetical protein PR202_ga31121 [Eleusine coracana subsp. coracana]|uniref:Uncharacterized protein n=1 Tax=Eleusine coracana subsp. coracana TaxID=191504 RepID=A0AAV5DPB6_ELECO|nr:hypothetical protein PR202_ga31121 [Eleusine coracana subsp. coracana]
MNVPKCFIKTVEKIQRGFMWQGKEKANGGCCLVSWSKVTHPHDLGGLAIPNLEVMSCALQIR